MSSDASTSPGACSPALPDPALPEPRLHPGEDVPDARGRTGLHLTGTGLTGNPDIAVTRVEVTSDGWHVLRRTTFTHRQSSGRTVVQQRETYDMGDGAAILLYDPVKQTVLLTRQFRFPAYVNESPDGMSIEVAAGGVEGDLPERAVRREAHEELGVTVGEVRHLFSLYMSPGCVTERVHYFASPYAAGNRTHAGGGLDDEGEDIEILELPFAEALEMVDDGRIADGKTVILLQWAALSGVVTGRAR